MEDEESIYADTDQTMTFQDLARALDRISLFTEGADTPLPFDPDDYPVVVSPPETRTHRLWRILAKVVQVIVISVMFLLIVGIIVIIMFVPIFC